MSAHVTWTVLDAARGLLLGVGEFNPATHTQKDASNNDVLVGLAAPVGSLFIDASAGTLYQKTGTDATAWTVMGGLPSPFIVATDVSEADSSTEAGVHIGINTTARIAFVDGTPANTRFVDMSGGKIRIFKSGTILASVDASGNVIAAGDVTAFGAP